MRKVWSILLVIPLLLLFGTTSFAEENQVSRIAGQDRFEVAVNVSKEGWPQNSDVVILANYLAFADALAAAPLAYKHNAPILLTHPEKLSDITSQEIKRLNAKKVILVGGKGSISDAVLSQAKALSGSVERIGGSDRFEVAYNISKRMGTPAATVVANGLNFPDALAIAPYAAQKGYPILLTYEKKLPDKTKQALVSKTIVVGGEGSVGKAVYDQLPGHQRIGGKDRYQVAANIIRDLNLAPTKSFVATGLSFADALTGSVLAANQQASLLLTRPDSLPEATKDIIQEKQIKEFTILGGTGSVKTSVGLELSNKLPLFGKTVVLDAGHGGFDNGASSSDGKYKEKDLNIQFTEKAAGYLKDLGANVILTRKPGNDVYISLEDRSKFSNSQNADLFVSIHHDSSYSEATRGVSVHWSSYRPAIETDDVYIRMDGKNYEYVKEDTEGKRFFYKDNGEIKTVSYFGNVVAYDPTPSPAAVKSKQLVPLLYNALRTEEFSQGGYTKDHNLYVTRWTTMPSVLVELGFMSNPYEVNLLANQNIQHERAKILANTIKDFLVK
ncbi:cell wall-binding repeat-containing protein [Pseudalkalibacillus caeni]|uniref:cell wall-binding repeat-containing protein n=1 Tax=Exobacillus caeni TaxID=2574798 RepID=UPI001485894B|nr:cell wall-binding repeat-containing protein [Pseudalkalibacillus caeni]